MTIIVYPQRYSMLFQCGPNHSFNYFVFRGLPGMEDVLRAATQSRRTAKRCCIIQHIKETEYFKNATECARLQKPDPNDTSYSKRTWEKALYSWRQQLRSSIKTHQKRCHMIQYTKETDFFKNATEHARLQQPDPDALYSKRAWDTAFSAWRQQLRSSVQNPHMI